MKILLISGHGAGDSGAVGCGFAEADLTRKATYILEGKLRDYALSVVRYSTARDCFQDLRDGVSVNLNFDLVVEVHFNAGVPSAHGTEVLYRDKRCASVASDICKAIASRGFTNRGAKLRTDLRVMNTCFRAGVPHLLIETCFITSSEDMGRYERCLYSLWGDVAEAICSRYGIKKLASSGSSVGTDKTSKVYATGVVKCYGTHGKGNDQVWFVDPDKKVSIPAKYVLNKKTEGVK